VHEYPSMLKYFPSISQQEGIHSFFAEFKYYPINEQLLMQPYYWYKNT